MAQFNFANNQSSASSNNSVNEAYSALNTLQQLFHTGIHFANTDGYWRLTGLESNPGLANLDFAEFFEPVFRPGHKKSFLEADGNMKAPAKGYESIMHGRVSSMVGLYKGLAATPRVIGQAFFMYSAGVTNWHLHACRIARTYGCQADLTSILESETVPEHEKKNIRNRSLALCICAFTLYEGSGALGGYNAQQWNLWARVFGMETPLQMGDHFVAAKEAAECCEKLRKAEGMSEKKSLFMKWLPLGYPGLPEGVGEILFTYWYWVNLYTSIESGSLQPDNTNPNHMGAILSGFIRRAAKGLLIATKFSLTEAFKPDAGDGDPLSLVTVISSEEEKITEMLSTAEGPSPFGKWVISMMEVQLDRMSLVEDIAKRAAIAEQNPQAKADMAKSGLAAAMSQRGKTRFARLPKKDK